MSRTGLPSSPSTSTENASVYLRPSWKMWPTSMPRADTSGPAPSGDMSPSRTSAASIVPSGSKSRPATSPTTCLPGASAPVIQLDHCRRGDRRDSGHHSRPMLLDRCIPSRGTGTWRNRRRRAAQIRQDRARRRVACRQPRGRRESRPRAAPLPGPGNGPSAAHSSTCRRQSPCGPGPPSSPTRPTC